MLIDSDLAGDWMASAYSIRGKRTDYKLSLNPNASYERRMIQEPDFERIEQGTLF